MVTTWVGSGGAAYHLCDILMSVEVNIQESHSCFVGSDTLPLQFRVTAWLTQLAVTPKTQVSLSHTFFFLKININNIFKLATVT